MWKEKKASPEAIHMPCPHTFVPPWGVLINLTPASYRLLQQYFVQVPSKVDEELAEHSQLKNQRDFWTTLAGMEHYMMIELTSEPWHWDVLSHVMQRSVLTARDAQRWIEEENLERPGQ